MVNSKQKFIDYVNLYIKRDGIQNVLAYLEQSDFYVAPASTMFHLNIEGGLCQHSINVFETALSIYTKTF